MSRLPQAHAQHDVAARQALVLWSATTQYQACTLTSLSAKNAPLVALDYAPQGLARPLPLTQQAVRPYAHSAQAVHAS